MGTGTIYKKIIATLLGVFQKVSSSDLIAVIGEGRTESQIIEYYRFSISFVFLSYVPRKRLKKRQNMEAREKVF